MQNDKAGFEENKKEFQKSVEISRQSKEIFKIEENTLKEENKIVDTSKSGENNITSDNITEKNSNNSNGNNYGVFKDSLEIINKKKEQKIKKLKNDESSSNSNNIENAIAYGNIKIETTNNSYYVNDTIKLKNQQNNKK